MNDYNVSPLGFSFTVPHIIRPTGVDRSVIIGVIVIVDGIAASQSLVISDVIILYIGYINRTFYTDRCFFLTIRSVTMFMHLHVTGGVSYRCHAGPVEEISIRGYNGSATVDSSSQSYSVTFTENQPALLR